MTGVPGPQSIFRFPYRCSVPCFVCPQSSNTYAPSPSLPVAYLHKLDLTHGPWTAQLGTCMCIPTGVSLLLLCLTADALTSLYDGSYTKQSHKRRQANGRSPDAATPITGGRRRQANCQAPAAHVVPNFFRQLSPNQGYRLSSIYFTDFFSCLQNLLDGHL